MPRKKKSENLRHKNVITLKLTDAELELLDHSSKILGLSRSEFLRKSFLEKDIQFRYEVVADMDELRKLVSKYGKIGSNLNQIARYFNTGGEWSEEMKDEIRQCISELFSLRKEVLRKYAVERQDYMDKPHEQEAGYKHRSTNKLLNHLKQDVMDMCNREGLHQVDLLSHAPAKMTRGEYWAKTHGQDELDKVNEKIRAAGLKPASTVFQTQKQFLWDAIDECSQLSGSFDEFQSLLLDRFNISVIEKRGSYRYLHPDRNKRISAESLGANYGKDFLEQVFQNHENRKDLSHESTHKSESASKADYHTDPFVIFYIKSELRLVTYLQTNVKAMQNQAYARKVKISNLQQMANTLIYIQDHGYDTREDLEKQTSDIQMKMEEAQDQLSDLISKMKTLNTQIHYTGQYFAFKSVYAEFLKSRNKKKFRQEHSSDIRSYEEARD